VPSTIAVEKATNPFLRFREPAIAQQLASLGRIKPAATALDTFAAMREWKNTF
jgi:hydroxyacylglutathione hydrolase